MEKVLERVRSITRELEEGEGETTRIAFDQDAGIIRIYGHDADYLKRAQSGLSDVQELAYTTAEHHPYWAVLFHSNEISRSLLENWDTELSTDQLSELLWRCDEMKMVLDRLAQK
jgi:hypothetical protein